MVKNHSCDSMLIASLFLSESERNNIILSYMKQSGYNARNPLFTAISVMTGNIDELFLEDNLMQTLLPSWHLHAAMVFKTLASGQSSAKFVNARNFLMQLADALLQRA